MTRTTHLPGAGDVTIELPALDGGPAQEITLKCSPDALFAICRQPGGFREATEGTDCVVNRVLSCDVATMALVIRLGSGSGPNTDPDLPKKIYAAGVLNLRLPLTSWLGNLGRGGKPLNAEDAGEPDASPPGAGASA